MASPVDLLKQSVSLFFKHFVYILLFWLIKLALYSVASIPVFLTIIVSVITLGAGVVKPANPVFITLIIVFALALIVLGAWIGAASMVQVNAVSTDKKVPYKDLFSMGWKLAWKLFATGLLVGLIVAFGLLILIIPGLIFAVWFTFTTPIIVTEKVTISQALSKSKALVKGRFWAVVKYLLFPILAIFLYSFIITTISAFIPWIKPLISLISVPIGTVFGIYSFLMYFAFRDNPAPKAV